VNLTKIKKVGVNMKKRLFLALIMICCLIPMTAFSQETLVAEVVEESTKITIYHTNDVHGYVTEDSENGVIGLARLAALNKTGEANGESVLFLDVGDATQRLPIASLT